MTSQRDTPVSVLSGNVQSPLLITCEHAGNLIPADLDNLGLDAATLNTHIAIDIGAAALAVSLRDRLQARLLEAVYSRLVVDLNRYPDDPSVILPVSDKVAVAGNEGLSPQQRSARIRRFHTPYHESVEQTLNELQTVNETLFMVFMHSFTPEMGGVSRPWEVGLLFHDEGAPAQSAATAISEAARMADMPELCIGFNEPYTASEPKSYALYEHAVRRNIDYLAIEVRQDLLGDSAGIERMAELLTPAIAAAFNFKLGT